MAKVFASGRELYVIWFDNLWGYEETRERLMRLGYDYADLILVKELDSDRAGLGTEDPELYAMMKLTV